MKTRFGRIAGLAACASCVGAIAVAGSASADTWNVTMSGARQTASGIPGDPDGTGTATITMTKTGQTGTVCSTVNFSNIAQPVVAAHIHQGLPTQPENPAWTVNLFGPNIGGTPSGVSTCSPATAAQINAMELAPQLFTVVVHNQAYPAGAIRGQLGHNG